MFLILATPTHGLLHVTYVLLINPILSDSFGFSEKESGLCLFSAGDSTNCRCNLDVSYKQ